LAHRLCLLLLADRDVRLPVPECQRLLDRVRDCLAAVPGDRVGPVLKLLGILSRTVGPTTTADRPAGFAPLDIASNPTAFWCRVSRAKVKRELRECARHLTEQISREADTSPASPWPQLAFPIPAATTPDGLLTPPLIDEALYTVHCSIERLDDCPERTPRASAVAVRHLASGQECIFSFVHEAELERKKLRQLLGQLDRLESRMLNRFFAFLANRPIARWLHWNMRSVRFGFPALAQRYLVHHGRAPTDMPPHRLFDFAGHLKWRFGRDFVGHPNLERLISMNGLLRDTYLDQVQSAAAWKANDFGAILRSLSYKVEAIGELYRRFREGRLVTAVGIVGVETPSDPNRKPRQVVLQGPNDPPLVCGREKRPLTRPQYDVVNALLEAGEDGLAKDQLDKRSGHGDARKILERLAKSDDDWNAVIEFPGVAGRGYRIR
jgi:hypothetical protein